MQNYIRSMRPGSDNIHACINDALKSQNIQNAAIKSYLLSLNKFAPGQLAYNFALPDTVGNIVRLSDLRGKVVLIDTWHYSCGACTQIHKILEHDVKPAIASSDFVIVSYSGIVIAEKIG